MINKFQKIIKTLDETKDNKIPIIQSRNNRNEEKYRNVQLITWNLSRINDLTTEYTTADVFEENNELAIIYKEWKIEIISHSSLEDKITTILPYIHYNIIYKEPVENNIGYSRSHEDLQNTYFFEIREELLYLHVGFSIAKAFNAVDDLKVPEVKLRIALRNSLKINQ
ncbi:MAG: hypothetical protein ACTSWR_12325 [Candidatus Helarchaeota archaeon]